VWLVSDHQLNANRGDVVKQLPLQSWLSKRGTQFDRAYTVLPICSPSRASMLTGLYPHNHGLTENDGRFGGRGELDPSDQLFSTAFREDGYRCGWFGKWHLSHTQSARDFGFEGWSLGGYGYPYGTPEYARYLRKTGLPDPVIEVELSGESLTPSGTRINLRDQSQWFDYEAGTAILNAPRETHEAFFLADMAADWVRSLNADDRFFMRVDPWGPHPPYIVPKETAVDFDDVDAPVSANLAFDLRHRPDHHRGYRDAWKEALPEEALDHQLLARRALGQAQVIETALLGLVDTLGDLGVLDDTIIVFTADHGDAVGSNGGALNKGGLMVEETMSIPLYVAGPNIPAGQTISDPVANIDLAPTLSQMCGVGFEQGDGESLVPLWNGEAPIRAGLMTEHYGLHEPLPQRAWYQGKWKLIVQADGFVELYDLANDPTEMTNLAGVVIQQDRLKAMHRALVAEMDRTGDSDARVAGIRTAIS